MWLTSGATDSFEKHWPEPFAIEVLLPVWEIEVEDCREGVPWWHGRFCWRMRLYRQRTGGLSKHDCGPCLREGLATQGWAKKKRERGWGQCVCLSIAEQWSESALDHWDCLACRFSEDLGLPREPKSSTHRRTQPSKLLHHPPTFLLCFHSLLSLLFLDWFLPCCHYPHKRLTLWFAMPLCNFSHLFRIGTPAICNHDRTLSCSHPLSLPAHCDLLDQASLCGTTSCDCPSSEWTLRFQFCNLFTFLHIICIDLHWTNSWASANQPL